MEKKVVINPSHPDSLEIKNENYARWESLKTEEYWEYRRKWNENPQNGIVERYPLNLDIEPTNACNLRCTMCPRTIALQKDEKTVLNSEGLLSFDVFKKIIDEVTEEGPKVYAVKLTHRGEPLIHKDFVKMVRYAKEKGIIDVMANTNGVLLNRELSEEIIDAGIDRMLFSFDAASKEKYEKIRVRAKYEEVLENIKEFASIRNAKKAWNTMIRVSMVMQDETIDEMEDYKKLFGGGTLADVVSFNRLVKEPVLVSEYEVQDEVTGKLINMKECAQLWQRMIINYNGNVEVCCPNFKEDYVIGNAKVDSIEELWHSEKLNAMRDKHRKGEWWKIPMCKSCNFPYLER